MTPLSANSSVPSANLTNSNKQNTSLGTSLLKNRMASAELNINRNNLNELSKVKESDILNDDDNDGGFGDQKSIDQMKNNFLRSSTNSISFTQHIKQSPFNFHENNMARNNLSAKMRTPSASSTIQPKTTMNTNTNNNTSLDDLLMSNKQMLKMNHIEDALASVLDDMKQLDFATTTPHKGYTQANPVLSTLKTSNNNFLKSMPLSPTNGNNTYGYFNTPIGSHNGNSLNIKTDSISKEQIRVLNSLNKQRTVNFNEDYDLSGSENSCEELNLQLRKNLSSQVKQLEKSVESLINGQDESGHSETNNLSNQRVLYQNRASLKTLSPSTQSNQSNEAHLNKRPDLVLDLPINLLVSSPNSVAITNNVRLFLKYEFLIQTIFTKDYFR